MFVGRFAEAEGRFGKRDGMEDIHEKEKNEDFTGSNCMLSGAYLWSGDYRVCVKRCAGRDNLRRSICQFDFVRRYDRAGSRTDPK